MQPKGLELSTPPLHSWAFKLDRFVPTWRALKAAVRFFFFAFCLLFFFFFLIQPQYLTKSFVNRVFVYYSWTHKFHFSVTFSLKMGPTILFTYLKIILLQCFQFQFSVSVTISLIQTNPLCLLGRPLVVASSYWARYSFASTISVQPKVIGPNNPGLWATTPTFPWIWSSHSIGLVFQFSNKQHERKN